MQALLKNKNLYGVITLLIVQKYGGSSVADKERIFNAASKIAASYDSGNNVVVIVSAQGNTTDMLIETANNIIIDAPKRELDMLLSTGEQQSAALMSMALISLGYKAISLNAWQAGIFTTDDYGNARITGINTERIKHELSLGKIVIIAGFQGINNSMDITTLGRGGSDTTAVAIAAALKADKCEIYTDVNGIYTADPRIVPNAVLLESIDYNVMLNYSSLGAKVLHNRSVELAKNTGIDISVKSSFSDNPGTLVTDCSEINSKPISGITAEKLQAYITISSLNDVYSLLKLLSTNKTIIDMVSISDKCISFSAKQSEIESILNKVKSINEQIKTEVQTDLAKISIVGTSLHTKPEVLIKIVEVLKANNINFTAISLSETKLCILVDESKCTDAINLLHKKLI